MTWPRALDERVRSALETASAPRDVLGVEQRVEERLVRARHRARTGMGAAAAVVATLVGMSSLHAPSGAPSATPTSVSGAAVRVVAPSTSAPAMAPNPALDADRLRAVAERLPRGGAVGLYPQLRVDRDQQWSMALSRTRVAELPGAPLEPPTLLPVVNGQIRMLLGLNGGDILVQDVSTTGPVSSTTVAHLSGVTMAQLSADGSEVVGLDTEAASSPTLVMAPLGGVPVRRRIGDVGRPSGTGWTHDSTYPLGIEGHRAVLVREYSRRTPAGGLDEVRRVLVAVGLDPGTETGTVLEAGPVETAPLGRFVMSTPHGCVVALGAGSVAALLAGRLPPGPCESPTDATTTSPGGAYVLDHRHPVPTVRSVRTGAVRALREVAPSDPASAAPLRFAWEDATHLLVFGTGWGPGLVGTAVRVDAATGELQSAPLADGVQQLLLPPASLRP